MESYLYLCTKSNEGEFIPFFRLDGSYMTYETDEKGGSVFNMECLISNINSKKFEDRVKKTEVLQSSTNNNQEVEENIEDSETNGGAGQQKGVKKEKKEERVMATVDLVDCMTNYLDDI